MPTVDSSERDNKETLFGVFLIVFNGVQGVIKIAPVAPGIKKKWGAKFSGNSFFFKLGRGIF